jgi:hypothetical protein
MSWVIDYFLLSSNALNHTKQYSFLFYTYVPYKTQFSQPSRSHIHELLAPPPPSLGHRPLLLPVSFTPLASSSLPAGGQLPHRGSSTQAGELPHRGAAARSASGRAPSSDLRTLIPTLTVAAVTCLLHRTVSFKATLKVVAVMRHSAETMWRPAEWRVDERQLP